MAENDSNRYGRDYLLQDAIQSSDKNPWID
jgi:hypothetical protein